MSAQPELNSEAFPGGGEQRALGPRAVPDPVALESHVTVHGLRLFVREQGHGLPLLMINGLGGNVEMWGPAEERLAAGSHTIAFDAPGTGRSRPSPVPLPLPAMARVIGRLLDELGHDRVDVIGYSLGGVMAQQLARSAPDRVRRLALCGTSCGWGGAPPEPLPLALIATPLRYFSPTFYRRTSHILDGSHRFQEPGLARRQAAARSIYPPSVIGYAQQFLQGTTWSSLHWAHTLEMPTLVVSGMCDRLVPPANGMLLAGRLPRSRFHALPGEGHLMLFDSNSAALALLEDFFWSEDVDECDAWRSGADVTDVASVEATMRASRGTQPTKAFSRAYRAWVRSSAVQNPAAKRLLRS